MSRFMKFPLVAALENIPGLGKSSLSSISERSVDSMSLSRLTGNPVSAGFSGSTTVICPISLATSLGLGSEPHRTASWRGSCREK